MALTEELEERECVFWDRENPLEFYKDEELKARYRFRRDRLMYILRAVRERLQRATQRSMVLGLLKCALVHSAMHKMITWQYTEKLFTLITCGAL